ncbi:hypothetical protein ACXR2U_07505 [Jatrophihabitans sp. YIM 134969]
MTATATLTPPVLYLVPGTARRRPPGRRAAPATFPGAVSALAALATSRVVGTLFAGTAVEVARALGQRAPWLARRGRPEVWAAAIAFLVAEEAELFDYAYCGTRTSVARDLGSSLPTLRRRVAAIREALDPLVLDLPAPDLG